jgi:hypothetical protein
MFATAPVLVLKRTMVIRLVLCIFVLPLVLLSLWGAYAALQEPADTTGAALLGGLAVGLGAFFWFFFSREMGRGTRVYEDGIEQVRGPHTTELRWNDVTEVWFQAVKVQAGGLIGAAVGAAMEASARKKGKPLDTRGTSITVKVMGRNGEKIVITSNDTGVLEAFEIVRARVNPRLVEEAKRQVQQGGTATFGKVSISMRGIANGQKEPVAFSEIEKFVIDSGRLRLKKKGAWLDAMAVPVQKIPNVFALTEVYIQLAAGPVDKAGLEMGRNLASRQMV